MARGWESKSVESQIESAEKPSTSAGRPELSGEQQQHRRERQQLLLSQAYVRRQFEAASNERYRESLRHALAEIERKLAALPPEK